MCWYEVDECLASLWHLARDFVSTACLKHIYQCRPYFECYGLPRHKLFLLHQCEPSPPSPHLPYLLGCMHLYVRNSTWQYLQVGMHELCASLRDTATCVHMHPGCAVEEEPAQQGDVRLVPLLGSGAATAACDEVHIGGVEIFNAGRWGRICASGDFAAFTLEAQVTTPAPLSPRAHLGLAWLSSSGVCLCR